MSELLDSIQQSQLKEGFLINILNDMVITKNEYDVMEYHSGGIFVLRYCPTRKFVVYNTKIFRVFMMKYNMSYDDTTELLLETTNKYTNWNIKNIYCITLIK